MLLSELMNGLEPDPSYVGITTADDMALALNLAATPAASPVGYFVAEQGITEAAGALEAQTQDSQYLRTGQVSTKTGTNRTFTINGDRMVGDAFQDAILAHSIKYGRGSRVVVDYVYFNMLTGIGEQGKVSIAVEDDFSGAAGENATFSVALTSTEEPKEYTYTAAG